MNKFLIWKEPFAEITGNVGPIVVDFKLPEGFAAILYDWSAFNQMDDDARYGYALYRHASPPEGRRAWTNDNELLDDADAIAHLMGLNRFAASGASTFFYPQTAMLWPLDYRVVTRMEIGGFNQVTQNVGFRIRYTLVKASKGEIAEILFWQNRGLKRA